VRVRGRRYQRGRDAPAAYGIQRWTDDKPIEIAIFACRMLDEVLRNLNRAT
jgi:hypothetical protein